MVFYLKDNKTGAWMKQSLPVNPQALSRMAMQIGVDTEGGGSVTYQLNDAERYRIVVIGGRLDIRKEQPLSLIKRR